MRKIIDPWLNTAIGVSLLITAASWWLDIAWVTWASIIIALTVFYLNITSNPKE